MRSFVPYLGTAVLLLSASVGRAEQSPATELLDQELAAKVPATWQIHVTQRDGSLLAFVTPPYQEAFNLWYEPEKLRATLQGLCPSAADPIWQHLAATQTLVLQPTVGGKSDDSMRIGCPREGAPPA